MRKKIALILTIILFIVGVYSKKEKIKTFAVLTTITLLWFLIELIIEKIIFEKTIEQKENKKYIEKNNKYEKKNLMTNSELEVYKKLKYIVKDKELILQSQIVLSSIINKITNNYYANELYRIVDFGIFNSNGEVLCLIELNDSTHLQKDRRIRDCKVKDILEEAQIPLITIWTNKENTIDYLEYRLQEYIA